MSRNLINFSTFDNHYNNDVALIKSAGLGFAVANAVPEAKAVASYITVSNDEHAIKDIIYGIESKKYVFKEK